MLDLASWDYAASVEKMRPLVVKWKTVTGDMLSELRVAREALAKEGRPKTVANTTVKTWSSYLSEIGLDRSTVHRWLAKQIEPEALPAPGDAVFLGNHEGAYPIIYCDPPWAYDDKAANTGRWAGAVNHYPCMSLEELRALDVNGRSVSDLAAADALLFMWATGPLLQRALDLIDAWDFCYKTVAFVWIKKYPDNSPALGLGNYTRQNAEYCLLGKRGAGIERKSKSVSSVIESPRMEHSQKPACARDRIVELCGDLPRIELFAREKLEGWDCWGNEATQEPLRFCGSNAP